MKNQSFLAVAIAFAIVVFGYAAVVNGKAIAASVTPFITTACSSTGPCIGGSNSSSGAGVLASSTNGRGLNANTKHNSTAPSNASYGVYGQDASTSGFYNSGVFGTSVRGFGVSGVSSTGTGVSAASSTGVALSAASTQGAGISSSGNYGVIGTGSYAGLYGSGTSYGVLAYGTAGLYASSSTGSALYAVSTSGNGLEAHTGGHVGALVTNSSGNGADAAGSYIGVVGRAPASGFPLVATDPTGANNLFYVDGAGNVYARGAFRTFVGRVAGSAGQLYGAQSTRPAVDETGTVRLTSGRASVYFSPQFARSIDVRRGYQVFLTPGGDTRGLYVSGKYARGFMVREVGGGRGTFEFDYHVYATARESEASSASQPEARAITGAPIEKPVTPRRFKP